MIEVPSALSQINDRYEFPDELDLDVEGGKWLSENADRSVRNLYKLHSVLVHSGGVHGGHYYAYIQPDGKRWLKFDDERVRALLSAPGFSSRIGLFGNRTRQPIATAHISAACESGTLARAVNLPPAECELHAYSTCEKLAMAPCTLSRFLLHCYQLGIPCSRQLSSCLQQ